MIISCNLAKEILISLARDKEVLVCHSPGVGLLAADALSGLHTGDRFSLHSKSCNVWMVNQRARFH